MMQRIIPLKLALTLDNIFKLSFIIVAVAVFISGFYEFSCLYLEITFFLLFRLFVKLMIKMS